MDLKYEKAKIRSILMASGKQATERSFRSDYYNQEGESFNRVLCENKKSFYEFMKSIPDVVRVWDGGDGLVLERVSTEQSSHMDNLTVMRRKKVRKSVPFRFRPDNGSYNRPLPRLTPNSSFVPQRQFNYASFYENNGIQHHAPPPPNGFSRRSANSQFYPSQPSTNGYSHKPFANIYQNNNIVEPAMKHYAPLKPVPNCVPASKPIPITPLKPTTTVVASTPAIKLGLAFLTNQFYKSKIVVPDINEPQNAVKPVAALSEKSSSDWSSVSGQGICSKTISFADFLMTRKRPTIEKIVKAEENPKDNYLKVAKFQESDLNINKTSLPPKTFVELEPLVKKADGSSAFDVNNYVTGTHKIANARMRQLKWLIYTPIKIIEVRSLCYFIFQYNIKQLETLTEEMSFHYKSMEASKHLSVKKPVCGMSVAIFNDGIWQRAEILMICPAKVLIRFVDTMKLGYVSPNDLRYLQKTFAELPRKSCQGMIAGIEPKLDEKKFNCEAENEFKLIVNDSEMFVVINGVENEIFKVSLFKGDTRVNISNILISKELVDKSINAASSVNAIII